MRRYETIIIAEPDLPDDRQESLFERMKEIIEQQEGMLIDFDDWGDRKLAYEIKKRNRGHYVRLDYCGTGAAVDELERFCRIDDRMLKFMTVLLDDNADEEAVRAEIAAREADDDETGEAEETAEEVAEEEGGTETEAAADEIGEAEETAPETDAEAAKTQESESEEE